MAGQPSRPLIRQHEVVNQPCKKDKADGNGDDEKPGADPSQQKATPECCAAMPAAGAAEA